ncbi:MAG: hypothetical protein JO020_27095 [Chloroflexi bacterium]|nr:hypothetical protein [Chloroflexota bacterium]MBV9897841.1 hypothetical protein [Chloroflexota bacterium]
MNNTAAVTAATHPSVRTAGTAATYPSVVTAAQTQTVRRLIIPGLAAGAAFLGFEMLAGAPSTSLWAFPQSIPQTVGLTAPTAALDPLALVLGVAIHLVFSVGLGLVFIALAQRLGLRGTGRLLIAGALFMWAESGISIWAVIHTFFPSNMYILFGAVPFWASFVGRTGFGLILAALYARMWTATAPSSK